MGIDQKRISAIEIRTKIKENRTIDEIRKGQLVRYGHIKRMKKNRWPKSLLYWNPTGKRKHGYTSIDMEQVGRRRYAYWKLRRRIME